MPSSNTSFHQPIKIKMASVTGRKNLLGTASQADNMNGGTSIKGAGSLPKRQRPASDGGHHRTTRSQGGQRQQGGNDDHDINVGDDGGASIKVRRTNDRAEWDHQDAMISFDFMCQLAAREVEAAAAMQEEAASAIAAAAAAASPHEQASSIINDETKEEEATCKKKTEEQEQEMEEGEVLLEPIEAEANKTKDEEVATIMLVRQEAVSWDPVPEEVKAVIMQEEADTVGEEDHPPLPPAAAAAAAAEDASAKEEEEEKVIMGPDTIKAPPNTEEDAQDSTDSGERPVVMCAAADTNKIVGQDPCHPGGMTLGEMKTTMEGRVGEMKGVYLEAFDRLERLEKVNKQLLQDKAAGLEQVQQLQASCAAKDLLIGDATDVAEELKLKLASSDAELRKTCTQLNYKQRTSNMFEKQYCSSDRALDMALAVIPESTLAQLKDSTECPLVRECFNRKQEPHVKPAAEC